MGNIEFIYQIGRLMRNRKRALRLLSDDDRRRKQIKQLTYQLKNFELPARGTFDDAVVVSQIGQALWLADLFGIELHIGTCFGDCRAELKKDQWQYDISPAADTWSYSMFFARDRAEVESIQAISRWPEIAIAQCVLNAKMAGVI